MAFPMKEATFAKKKAVTRAGHAHIAPTFDKLATILMNRYARKHKKTSVVDDKETYEQ